MAQAKASIQPGFQFYHQKFSVQFHGTVRAFKAARLCCPVQVQALNPTAASLEELRNFPFANDDATIANLAQELPLYLAASDGVTVTCEDDKLTWWANHKDTLPHWSSLVKKLLLIQPSSASAVSPAESVLGKLMAEKIKSMHAQGKSDHDIAVEFGSHGLWLERSFLHAIR